MGLESFDARHPHSLASLRISWICCLSFLKRSFFFCSLASSCIIRKTETVGGNSFPAPPPHTPNKTHQPDKGKALFPPLLCAWRRKLGLKSYLLHPQASSEHSGDLTFKTRFKQPSLCLPLKRPRAWWSKPISPDPGVNPR